MKKKGSFSPSGNRLTWGWVKACKTRVGWRFIWAWCEQKGYRSAFDPPIWIHLNTVDRVLFCSATLFRSCWMDIQIFEEHPNSFPRQSRWRKIQFFASLGVQSFTSLLTIHQLGDCLKMRDSTPSCNYQIRENDDEPSFFWGTVPYLQTNQIDVATLDGKACLQVLSCFLSNSSECETIKTLSMKLEATDVRLGPRWIERCIGTHT